MKNSKISKKAKTFLDGLQKYRDGGMQVPLPEYQDGVLAPMAPDPNWINCDPSLIQGPELFAYPNQNPMSIQPPMAINPPIQKPIPTPTPKPNFNAIPVIGSAITLGMGIKEGVESYQAKKRADRLRGYFDQDLAERKKDIGLGEYVNTPYSQYQDGGMLPSWMNPKNWGVTDYSDKGDFNTAFFEAKKAGEEEFMYNNKRYNTKSNLTPDQQVKAYGITDNQRVLNPSEFRKNVGTIKTVSGYGTSIPYIVETALGTRKEDNSTNSPNSSLAKEQDALRLYLGLPQQSNTFRPSRYKKDAFELTGYNELLPNEMPSDEEINFYGKPLFLHELNKLKGTLKNKELANPAVAYNIKPMGDYVMGRHTVRKGKDDRGEYIEYIDNFDFDTYKYNNIPVGEIGDKFNKPYSIYGRKYYKDYGDGVKKAMYYTDKELSELDIDKKNFDTLALQRELGNRGYKLPKSTKRDGTFDGIMGDETKKALLEYRKSQDKQEFKEGGIHIDPKNKGKFTAAAKRRGMGVQEFANKVMANKEDYSPLLVKRANFAKNAAKWEDGGMYSSVSSDYNTTVELANQRKEQAMELLQKMEEVVQLHKMMYGGEMEEFKGGGEMIKRADGSYSRVGLWDRIRANKGSGKKPTKEMLKQERKIRSEEMEYGGYMPFMDSMDENNQYMDLPEFGNGGYKVERSSDRKGKTHKVTGPDGSVKYFGDPNMGERSKSKYGKEAFYARHKSNLEKNPHFRAYARATWQNGGQVGLEGFGQMYDNQQAYNQNTQRQFEEYYNNLNQQNVANWKNMRTSAINNIVSGVGGLATAGMGLPGMQSGGEYDPTLDVNSNQFDANAFLGREDGQPSELDALIQAEQAKQMQRSETEMELMNFINEGADTGQANYSNLGMFANNSSSSSSSSSLAGAGEFANIIDEIKYRESRGNYGRVNDVSKTTGAYQFMPIWWADQIQDFMGIDPSASQEEVMEAFRTNPQAQDAFMVHVVNNIYKPQLPKLRPYAQKYGLNDDQLIKLMHYRGIGDATKRLKTGDFAVSEKEKKVYNNPDVMEYLKGPLPK